MPSRLVDRGPSGGGFQSAAEWPRTAAWVFLIMATAAFLPVFPSLADSPQTTTGQIQGIPAPPQPTPQPPPGTLQLGLYVTAIDELDLLGNSFNAQFYLSTVWRKSAGENPSDSLRVLNAIHNSDITRFELISQQNFGDLEWRLYAVRNKVINPWILSDYPFDSQLLRIRIGMSNPMENSIAFSVDRLNSYVHPELILYDWHMGSLDLVSGAMSIVGNLGMPGLDSGVVYQVPVVNGLIEMRRRGHLEFVPSFLGYFLAIGLCVLALAISRSRDDLILGAVVSAAANSVYLAEILPVSALGGFSGQIQIIVYTGILYAATADELTDHVPPEWGERIASVLKLGLLPAYLLATVLAIYFIVPSHVM
ncbi:MAG: hypothetical protein P8Q97_05660 [Myxococcota bacterium]|jgi:hypothetical protein|nr:hypothetical protein [Myxococcota bacterium]